MKWRRRTDADIDQAIGDVTWNKPHSTGAGAAGPAEAAHPPAASPGTGHHRGHRRGSHMVIDTWECGCIYTWTRATGWVHDHNCLTDTPVLDVSEIERFLRDIP